MQELDIVSILLQAAVIYGAFKLGQWTIIVKVAKDIQQKLQLGTLTEEQVDDALGLEKTKEQEQVLLEIERVGQAYYAYSSEGQFLAQGTDFRGLLEAIKKQHPNRNFRLNKYQPNLTEEETGRLVKSIFEIYGDKNEKT